MLIKVQAGQCLMDNISCNCLNNTGVNKVIKTIKYLAQGHKDVGTSGARTNGLEF